MESQIERNSSQTRLSSGDDQGQSTERNVSPPNAIDPEDTFTAPPLGTLAVDNGPADVDAALATPLTPPHESSNKPSLVKRLLGPPVGRSPTAPPPVTHRWLGQGITGSDHTLPMFDGTSQRIEDHLIDIDTDSMETTPDVRVYFWEVGFESHVPANPQPPTDLEERKIFDAQLVRAGREYLKELRSRGTGWFLSSERDVIARNQLGSDWYRSPTTAICYDISEGILPALENECAFVEDDDYLMGDVIATNMRVPLWWVETQFEGIVPGIKGWDQAVIGAYTGGTHPGYAVFKGTEREEVINNLVRNGGEPTDWVKAGKVLRRDWPDVASFYDQDRYSEFIGPGYLELQGITADQFLGRTK